MSKTIGGLQTTLFAGDISTASQVVIGVGFGTPEDSQQFPFDELLKYAAGIGLDADQSGINLDLDSLSINANPSASDYLVIATAGGASQKTLISNLPVNTDLGVGNQTGTQLDVTSSTGTDATLTKAVPSGNAGLLSGDDQAKLDGIADTANNYVHPDHSGDVASSGDGATSIQPGAVTLAMLDPTAQTNLGNTPAADTLDITSSTGTPTTLPAANATEAGILSSTFFNALTAALTDQVTPEQFGAANDNATDDSSAVQQAITAAGNGTLYLRPGAGYRIVTPLVVTTPGLTILGEGPGTSRLTTAKTWQNAPVLDLQADNCMLRDFSIEEDSADARDSGKSGSQNAGIGMNSKWHLVDNVHVIGFGHPLYMRNLSANQASDNTIENCQFSLGYAWGVEVDSAENVTIRNTHAFNNGIDGFKLQAEHVGLPQNFLGDRLFGYLNGQRDTAAGGTESNDGNGIDIWNGGYRWRLINCFFWQNFGAGLYMKGDPPVGFPLGEGHAVNCYFLDAAAISTGPQAGVDIVTTPNSAIHFTACTMSGNTGDGIKCRHAHSVTISQSNIIENKRYGVFIDGGYDCTVRDTNIFGNEDIYGVRIGNTNDNSQVSRRHLIDGCRISGNYDPALPANADPRDAKTEIKTQRGVQIFSDSAECTIRRTHIYNVRDYTVHNYALKTCIDGCWFYDMPSFGIYSQASGEVTVLKSVFKHANYTIQFSNGSGSVPSPGSDVITGGISGATAVLKAIQITGGSFATNDASGIVYLYEADTADFQVEQLGGPGYSMDVTAIDTPRMLRAFGGNVRVRDNDFSLSVARASAISIYIDDTVSSCNLEGNTTDSNFSQNVIVESGVSIISLGTTYTENQVPPANSPPGYYQVQQGDGVRGVYASNGVGALQLLAPFDSDGPWPIF